MTWFLFKFMKTDLEWAYLEKRLGKQGLLDVLACLPGRRALTPRLVAAKAGVVLPESEEALRKALEELQTLSARAMQGYTDEQQAVIDNTSSFLAVNAFAGAGKTTTLKGLARANPDKRILYLAFNKEMSDVARRAMPHNVHVATVHSYALHHLGWGKKKLETQLKPLYIKRQYERGKFAALFESRPYRAAKIAFDALNAYCQQDVINDVEEFGYRYFMADERRELAAALLKDMWRRANDPNDDMPTTHDVYLKYWQLQKPKIDADLILLDEAQDVSAPMYSVFVSQEHARRILVGDRHQAIYDFRGAINAMQYAADDGAETLYLTKTFRFGQSIADLANRILAMYKGEEHRIRTNKTDSKITNRINLAHAQSIDYPFCVITRTNAQLFEIAYALTKAGIKFSFAGNITSYPFFKAQDVFFLALGQKSSIIDRFIAEFNSFAEYKEYAKESKDIEEIMLCNFVEKYQKDGIRIIAEVQAKNDPSALITLTTAHKSKGSEWDEVYLGDDFVSLFDENGNPTALMESEANLLYVAVTRAKYRLQANSDCLRLLQFSL